MDILLELIEHGQSYWLDNLTRDMLRGGALAHRVTEQGLRGVTSNPAIFHKAITSGSDYDVQIRALAEEGASVERIYESLVVTDVQEACDVLRPVYESSAGVDGYVSLEVSPYLMHDTEGSLTEARRLWAAVGRPNLMIKIPGTSAGAPAVEELLCEGINVNVTLLFSVDAYEEVARAYIRALERRVAEGKPVDTVASVASFFLSRIDVLVDGLVSHHVGARHVPPAQSLYGRAAVASARLAYRRYLELKGASEWRDLAERGARPQRLLWASTSTKNPLYDPVRYVEPLIGRDTVNTMPEVTIEAFSAYGRIVPNAVEDGVEDAARVFEDLQTIGIDMDAVCQQLLAEGARKFLAPFDALLSGLAARRAEMREGRRVTSREPTNPPGPLTATLAALHEQRFALRLFDRDPTVWTDDAAIADAISNRLGWTRGSAAAAEALPDLVDFAASVRAEDVAHIVLLGMGGSSLCPLVASRTFEAAGGFPELLVLDDVDPASVARVDAAVDPLRTLFVVASKSGTTIETLTLYRYFLDRLRREDVPAPGSRFVAITDPGSALLAEAGAQGFRRVIESPTDVGGRFSALTPFGLLPMALMGADVNSVVEWARQLEHECTPSLPESANPAIRLGATLALLAKAGRNKLTLNASPGLATFPLWVEQLVAESTGKDGEGILPITGEPVPTPTACGADRVFVHYRLAGDEDGLTAVALAALEEAGHPVLRFDLPEPEALGGEFLRWEIATATAGALLGVNPFDEPDVAAAKQATSDILERRTDRGELPSPEPAAVEEGLAVYGMDNARAGGGASVAEALAQVLDPADGADYVAVLGYFAPSEARDEAVRELRNELRRRTGLATTFGYGPRYLHSTGQLHKGGPEGGVFLVLTADPVEDLTFAGAEFSLGTLHRAQALGDVEALRAKGRRVARVHLGWPVEDGLKRLARAIGALDS